MHLGPRIGDGAQMALIELVGSEAMFKKRTEERRAKRDKRDASAKKRAEAAAPEAATGETEEPTKK
jgi:hypothetical protein